MKGTAKKGIAKKGTAKKGTTRKGIPPNVITQIRRHPSAAKSLRNPRLLAQNTVAVKR